VTAGGIFYGRSRSVAGSPESPCRRGRHGTPWPTNHWRRSAGRCPTLATERRWSALAPREPPGQLAARELEVQRISSALRRAGDLDNDVAAAVAVEAGLTDHAAAPSSSAPGDQSTPLPAARCDVGDPLT
jgi:hypothetical protein